MKEGRRKVTDEDKAMVLVKELKALMDYFGLPPEVSIQALEAAKELVRITPPYSIPTFQNWSEGGRPSR